MLQLRDEGIVPSPDRSPEDWATGQLYSAKVLSRELPTQLKSGERTTIRLHIRNKGARIWNHRAENREPLVSLRVFLDERLLETVRLRQSVLPTADCHFAFELHTPMPAGSHRLVMKLIATDTACGRDNEHLVSESLFHCQV